MPRTISYDRHGFILDGKRVFLLNGTIPYYRLHRDDWAAHLDLLRASGYTGVDVYVPWNYHELEPGKFDFNSGNRDLGAFLDAIGSRGLVAYLRPGPYICNEWNCGGLPQWLQRVEGLRIRENEPQFVAFATRYLREVCAIARERQYTRGGAIILFAVENEYDFYPTQTDRHAYISQLRDAAREAGIEVPLVACVGGGAAVRSATGFAEGVIPTPNYYISGMVEQKVEDMRRHLLAQRFADGAPMSDLPVFVTEMGRKESDQLRITAGGVKGLGPFNFSGGSHVGFWNGLTNWGGVTPISSAVDFKGMVGFDGTARDNFWATRRVTGFIHAFEPELLLCETAHSRIVDAPRADNPQLGEPHYDSQDRRVYSLLNGGCGFVFLANTTKEPQATRVTQYQRPAFPRRAPLTLAPGAIRVMAFGVPLARWGLPGELLHATGQVLAFNAAPLGAPTSPSAPAPNAAAELALWGEENETFELMLTDLWQGADPAPGASAHASIEHESDGTLLLLKATREINELALTCAGKTLRVIWMTRAAAETWRLPSAPALIRRRGIAKTLHDAWQRADIATPPAPRPSTRPAPRPMTQMLPLDRQGIERGAAWHSCDISTPAHPPRAALVLERALDLVSVYWDGELLSTQWGIGDPLTFIIPTAISAGTHKLDIRAEIWGHSTFHDENQYATRLDAERGIIGAITLNNAPLDGAWTLHPESEHAPPPIDETTLAPAIADSAGIALASGAAHCFERALDRDYPLGAVLTLSATQAHGEIWLDDWHCGRYVLGLLTPREKGGKIFFAGGPENEFFLPGALARKGARLRITARANAAGGCIERITLAEIEAIDAASRH